MSLGPVKRTYLFSGVVALLVISIAVFTLVSCSTPASKQKNVWVPPNKPTAEFRGKVEIYFTGTYPVALLKVGSDTYYVLRGAPNCKLDLPPEDTPKGMITWRTDKEYKVIGYVGDPMNLGPPLGKVPMLIATYVGFIQ